MLNSLGIDGIKPVATIVPSSVNRSRKAKFSNEFVPTPGERSSKRIKAAVVEGENNSKASSMSSYSDDYVAPDKVPRVYSYISDYVAESFRDEKDESDGSGGRPKNAALWDLCKKHQHLQISSSRRTVATTGCAGYGAVLTSAAKDNDVAVVEKGKTNFNSSTKAPKSWKLRVLRQGVGGFAVGVASAKANKPFKSLSNRPDCWVVNSLGMFCHNRKEVPVSDVDLEGSGGYMYDADDTVQICLSRTGTLSVSVNGGDNLCLCERLPPGKYVLCCQPYMGGVARLL